MYRVSRFFVSDITAGDNLLQQARFAVCKEGERADHGVIVAANGSCKTTLLSFLLSVFCPHKDRFVQYVQSGGDKRLEQYLIPGRPAVVLLHLVATLEANLFDAAPEEHLVVGQILHRHKTDPSQVDRIHFVADSPTKTPEFFDALEAQWESLLESERPWQAVRAFLQERVFQTTSQREWEEQLERLELDPWLLNRQVDFARTEGGIKDAFRFKNEEEFLSFFLGCVSDLETADSLRTAVKKTLEKVKHRPERNAQLSSILRLREELESYDDKSASWRKAREESRKTRLLLGEVRHVMEASRIRIEKAHAETGDELKGLTRRIGQTRTAKETAQANGKRIAHAEVSGKLHRLKTARQDMDGIINGLSSEIVAVEGAGLESEWKMRAAELRMREEALERGHGDIAPLRQKTLERAAQYHFRIDGEKSRLQAEIGEMEKADAALSKESDTLRREREGVSTSVHQLQRQTHELTTRIETAETAARNLKLEPGETSEQAQARFADALATATTRMEEITATMDAREEDEREAGASWKRQHARKSALESGLEKAKREVSRCLERRTELETTPLLQRMAGTERFDVTRPELLTRLREWLARQAGLLSELHTRKAGVLSMAEALKDAQSVAVDAETRKLHLHLLRSGISPSAVRPAVEALWDVLRDSGAVADRMAASPGRFSGLVVASKSVRDAVCDIPVPEDLYRPIPLLLADTLLEETPASGDAVITPKDAGIYSPDFVEKRRKHLEAEQETVERRISETETGIDDGKRVRDLLESFQKAYPDSAAIDALSAKVAECETEIREVTDALEKLSERQETLAAERKRLQTERATLTGKARELEIHRKHIEDWVAQYGSIERLSETRHARMTELSEAKVALDALEKKLEALRVLQDQRRQEKGKLREEVMRLDFMTRDIPLSRDVTLTDEREAEARDASLDTLKSLHEQARELEHQMESELGLSALSREVTQLASACREIDVKRKRFASEKKPDSDLLLWWASRTEEERSARLEEARSEIDTKKDDRHALQTDIALCGSKQTDIDTDLRKMATKGIRPDIADLPDTPEALAKLAGFQKLEEDRFQTELERLAERMTHLETRRKAGDALVRELAPLCARLEIVSPVWDAKSPRWEFPRFQADSEALDVKAFSTTVARKIADVNQLEKQVESRRKLLTSSFDRLQDRLRDETIQKQLPPIVDQLRRHDAESLADQCPQLVAQCDNLAENIRSEIARSDRFVSDLVGTLFQQTHAWYKKLQKAIGIRIPEDVFIYGGKPILQMNGRLDFNKNETPFRESINSWLDELITRERLPEANSKSGNQLGSELLYRLLRASSGKPAFGIRILKCDDTARHYEAVGKDLGSGGEALTTAVLLYSLLTSMRQQKRNNKEEKLPAFLIADNPLGVCNRSDFLDAQLKVARSMGIQCVYFTGIHDQESLGLFQHRVAIRKGDKRVRIGDRDLHRLEVFEQNVEEVPS